MLIITDSVRTPTRAVILACILALASGCHHLSPTEEKVTGVWEGTGIDTTVRVVYRRDHTVVELFPEENSTSGWLQFQVGTWRLEAHSIVEETKGLRFGNQMLADGGRTEIKFREIRADRIVREEGRPDFVRANVQAERFWQVFFALCIAVAIIIFAKALYGIGSALRWAGRALIAGAAAAACVWAMLNLAAKLSFTGNLIVSPSLFQALKLPTTVFGSVSLVLFVVGVVWFRYSTLGPRRGQT